MAKSRNLTIQEERLSKRLHEKGMRYIYPSLWPKWQDIIETYLTVPYMEFGHAKEMLQNVLDIMATYEKEGFEAAISVREFYRPIDLILLEISKMGTEYFREVHKEDITPQTEARLQQIEQEMAEREYIARISDKLIHPKRRVGWDHLVQSFTITNDEEKIHQVLDIIEKLKQGSYKAARTRFVDAGQAQDVLYAVLYLSPKGPQFVKTFMQYQMTDELAAMIQNAEEENLRLGISHSVQDTDERLL